MGGWWGVGVVSRLFVWIALLVCILNGNASSASILRTEKTSGNVFSTSPIFVNQFSIKIYKERCLGQSDDVLIEDIKVLYLAIYNQSFLSCASKRDFHIAYKTLISGSDLSLANNNIRLSRKAPSKKWWRDVSVNDLCSGIKVCFNGRSSTTVNPTDVNDEYISYSAKDIRLWSISKAETLIKDPSPFSVPRFLSRVGASLSSFHTSDSGLGSSLSGPSGDGCVHQRCYDSGSAESGNDEGEFRPKSLLLRRLHRTPLYAEISLVCVLGVLTGLGINVGARRWVKGRGGWWWLAGGLSCYGLAVIGALLIG